MKAAARIAARTASAVRAMAARVPTYINAYSTTETMQRAVVDALLGNIPWNHNNPVDPFCGLEDARY